MRTLTERLAAPLSPEDQTAQSMPDASPARLSVHPSGPALERTVTHEDWLTSMDDGGDERPDLWLSDGWQAASCVTPPGQGRPTHRSSLPGGARWSFSGLRLARS